MHPTAARVRDWFLLGLACCLLPACGELNPDPQAREAAEWALQRGGTVRVFDIPGEIRSLGRLPRSGFALEEINMNELGFEQEPVTDEELRVLEGLTNLRSLGLYGSRVTDKGAETIAKLTTLRELELSQSRITDVGLAKLATLPNLEKLFIRNVGDGVTDEGAAAFERQSDAMLYR